LPEKDLDETVSCWNDLEFPLVESIR